MAIVGSPIVIDKKTGNQWRTGTVQGALDMANEISRTNRPQLAGAARPGAPGTSSYVPGLGTVKVGAVRESPSAAAFRAKTANGGFSAGYGNDTELGQLAKGTHASQRGPTVIQNGIEYGANGAQFTPAGGSSSGMQSTVSNAINKNITTPGIKPADVAGMVTRARSSVARGAVGQRAAATNALRAAGFGNSGDRVGSMVDINTAAAGQANRMARDIELDAARTNAGMQSQAISQGLQLAGMEADQARINQQRADMQQREALAAAVPEFTMGGFNFGGRGGLRGGGANARDTADGPWTLNPFRGSLTLA